jgi:exosortase
MPPVFTKPLQSNPSNMRDESTPMKSRLFLLFLTGAAAFSGLQAWRLAVLAFTTDQYSHILVVPLVTGCLLYLRRRELRLNRVERHASSVIALLIALAAVTIRAFEWIDRGVLSRNDGLSLATLSLVLLFFAGFIFLYGAPKAARFPLLFLLLAVPIPDFFLHMIVVALQRGSAGVVSFLYSVFHVPFLRDGMLFQLPGGAIEIAEECSGIRSSIAFLILSLVACEFSLRTRWKKLLIVALVFPLVLVKNGIRIVTLSLLGFYVDRGFLTGKLHQMGGIVFFLLAILLWLPWLEWMHRSEADVVAVSAATGRF